MLVSNVKNRIGSDFGLLGVAILWGLTFPLIRMAVQEIDPLCFVAYRFLIASLIFLPYILLKPDLRKEVVRAWPAGLALGLIAFIFFITQTIGLRTVSSPRAAFITGTYVLMVPLFAPVFKSSTISKYEWISALIAILGLFLLLNPESSPAGLGELLVFCCATFVAIHIHCMQKVCLRSYNPTVIAFLQILTVAFCATVALPFSQTFSLSWGVRGWVGLLICAVVITIGTFVLQSKFQKQSTPQRTAIIFALEPLFATLFGYMILGESLTFRGALGAAILFSSLIISQRTKKRTFTQQAKILIRKSWKKRTHPKVRLAS